MITGKPWDEITAEDVDLWYTEPFDIVAELSASTQTDSAEEVEIQLDSAISDPVQTPAMSAGVTTTWSSPEPTPPVQTPSVAADRQVQELQQEVQRLRAELQSQAQRNNFLEQSLKDQHKLVKDKATCLDQATVLLQTKEEYIYQTLKKNKELEDKLKNQVQLNQRLQQKLNDQLKMNKDKSIQLDLACSKLQKNEDYINELGDYLRDQAQKNEAMELNLKTELKDTCSQLDQAKLLLQTKEDYICNALLKNKKLSHDLQDQVEKNATLELNLQSQLKEKSSQLKQANVMLEKKEYYIEKLLLTQDFLQKQRNNCAAQRPRKSQDQQPNRRLTHPSHFQPLRQPLPKK